MLKAKGFSPGFCWQAQKRRINGTEGTIRKECTLDAYLRGVMAAPKQTTVDILKPRFPDAWLKPVFVFVTPSNQTAEEITKAFCMCLALAVNAGELDGSSMLDDPTPS